MRLIDTSTLELQEFPSEDRLKYAVLSHTWGDGEVTFGDMNSPATRKAKRGWAKIQKTCQLAKSAGLKYAWVDTCCIDKSSSSELSESINSMFRWYAAAHVCYVYLEDLSPHESIEQGLPACRWVTRGWTLQELIAPRDVRFFDSTWSHRGSKADLESVLEEYTHIPASILQGKQLLSDLAIAMRMSWAANRETTRVEDMAYSLMGLFDVNMPLLYGEGIKAFRRLQEEILRRTNDMSILAWNDVAYRERRYSPLLALNPAAFSGVAWRDLVAEFRNNYTVTNKGLRLTSSPSILQLKDGGSQIYALTVAFSLKPRRYLYIRLRKLAPDTFCRVGELQFAPGDEIFAQLSSERNYYLLIDEPGRTMDLMLNRPRSLAAHIPLSIKITSVSPYFFWDSENRIFLGTMYLSERTKLAVYAAMVGIPVRGGLVKLVVLLQRSTGSPQWTCRLYKPEAYPRETRWIFSPSWERECLYWPDLEFHAPELVEATTDMTTVYASGGPLSIKASMRQEQVAAIVENESVYVLHFEEGASGRVQEVSIRGRK